MAGVGYTIQALADFLVADVCHACAHHAEDFRSLVPPSDRAAAALAAPVRIGHRRAGIDTHPLCPSCAHRLVAIRNPVRIGTVHHDGSVSLESGGRLPPVSTRRLAQETELAVWPAFETDDRLLAVVHALKFSRRERLAPWLARALALGLPAAALRGDETACIVAVPADAASLRQRGFNQAERLARAFAASAGTSLVDRALVKTRTTARQSLLDGAERARNVADAFVVAPHARFGGRRIVVVDDLVTTGATAAACAVALYAAGAREVRIACVGYRP